MSRTIRRKNVTRYNDWCDKYNETRNRNNANLAYVHGDMINMSPWGKGLKNQFSRTRRAESRDISISAVKAQDCDDVFFSHDDKHAKGKANPWFWD